jgi:hypothetical protein
MCASRRQARSRTLFASELAGIDVMTKAEITLSGANLPSRAFEFQISSSAAI